MTAVQDVLNRVIDTAVAAWRYAGLLHARPSVSRFRSSDDRVLLFVTGFPPDISGGVYRPASLSRYASDLGWSVTVVTHPAPVPSSEAGAALLEYVGPRPRILRTPSRPLQPSHRLFPQIDGSMVAAMDMVASVRKEFDSDLPGVLVASGPSFSTFVAALLLVQHTDRKLVLEYRDEWTLCPFDFVSKSAADLAWERRCLERADLVVLTTESQKRHLEQSFPELVRGKCEVVPNGWEPALLSHTTEWHGAARYAGQEVWLTFAGMLGNYADPGDFLATLGRVMSRRADLLSSVRVRFVGKKRPQTKSRLREFPFEGVVQDIDQVPPAVATRLMRESDAVLLFHSAHFERYIPGKLYEYAASGTPILLFDDCGESTRIVEGLGLGRSLASKDESGLEAALDFLVAARAKPRQSSQVEADTQAGRWLAEHTRESLAKRFFDLIGSRLVLGQHRDG